MRHLLVVLALLFLSCKEKTAVQFDPPTPSMTGVWTSSPVTYVGFIQQNEDKTFSGTGKWSTNQIDCTIQGTNNYPSVNFVINVTGGGQSIGSGSFLYRDSVKFTFGVGPEFYYLIRQ